MKYLNTKMEICEAINFGKYPVLSIDLASGDYYRLTGCQIRIDCGTFSSGHPRIIGATLHIFSDDKKLTTSGECCCLSEGFTYSDYRNIVERAQAPLVHPGEEVVVAIFDSRLKRAYAPIVVKTNDRADPFSATPMSFEDADMSDYLQNIGYVFPKDR